MKTIKSSSKKSKVEKDDIDSTTNDPTKRNTEISYSKKHTIGDQIKKQKK